MGEVLGLGVCCFIWSSERLVCQVQGCGPVACRGGGDKEI